MIVNKFGSYYIQSLINNIWQLSTQWLNRTAIITYTHTHTTRWRFDLMINIFSNVLIRNKSYKICFKQYMSRHFRLAQIWLFNSRKIQWFIHNAVSICSIILMQYSIDFTELRNNSSFNDVNTKIEFHFEITDTSASLNHYTTNIESEITIFTSLSPTQRHWTLKTKHLISSSPTFA